MKQTIKLTEQDLHRIVKKSVDKILNEGGGVTRSTAVDKIRQCHYDLDRVLDTIKNNIIDTIDSIKDGTGTKIYSKLMHDFKYSYPQMINKCYEPIIDEYFISHTLENY